MAADKTMVQELKEFLMKGNVVDLAVAVVIGVAFGAVVTALVDNIINPLIAAVFGEPDISGVLAITLRETDAGDAVLSIGGFLQALLDFIIIGTVLFFVVKAYNKLQDMRGPGEEEDEAGPSSEDLLADILAELRAQRTV